MTDNAARSMLTRLATAPISWGICEVPGWGEQLPADRVRDEMHELGFTATELGEAGFFPNEPAAMRDFLGERNMTMIGGFVSLVMHQPDEEAATLAEAGAIAAHFATCGATHFVSAAVTDKNWSGRVPLTNEQWDHLAHMFAEVEKITTANGLIQVIHPHVNTVIETADEVQRVLDTTEVRWCLDTGHLAIGGFDPLDFATRHADRVGLVHLKDTKMDVATRFNAGELSLLEAVQAGMFVPLGDGDLPIAEVIQHMENAEYDDWYVLEQDVALTAGVPPRGQGPMEMVAESLGYLRTTVAERLTSSTENNS